MSITSQVAKSGPFVGASYPQAVANGFPFQQASDLLVINVGSSGAPHDPPLVMSLNSDYTVSGGGYNASNAMQTGTVTLTAGGANNIQVGDIFWFLRNVPVNQIASAISSPLTGILTEEALDKQATINQQLQEQANRSLRFEPGEVLDGTLLLSLRKNSLLGFDLNGAPSFTPITGLTQITPVTTIAALRAVPVSLVQNNAVFALLGYYAQGDGGGGEFYYSSSSVASDNGGTVIAPNIGSGRWLRFTSGTVDVKWFGAKGDNSNDDTTAIQAAINSGAPTVLVSNGAYLISLINLVSNQVIQGAGMGLSTIKRKASSGVTGFINGSSISNTRLTGLTVDGNRANNTLGCNCITVTTSNNFTLERCEVLGGKTNSGFGAGLTINTGTNQAAKTCDSILYNYIHDNDDAGVLITKEWYVRMQGNLCVSNKSGLNVINFTFPPVSNVQNYFQVKDNYCISNTTSGISFYGFTTGGNSTFPIEGATVPPQVGCVISGNTCYLNGQYGIAFQGSSSTISGNVCQRNGTTSNDGGILFNAWNSNCTGNVLDDNALYGIDAGGSLGCSFSGNIFRYQGSTSGLGAVALNMGATVNCSVAGNSFENNGGSGQSSIYAPGWEFGNNTYFDQLGSSLVITGNSITLNANAIGINIVNGFDNVVVTGNIIRNATANCALILQGGTGATFNVVERDNYDVANAISPVLASASTLVIPDAGSTFFVTGTTTINTIRTFSQNTFNQKVRFVQITAGGSGYLVSSPPTVGFSGGGGTGAAGTALISNSGAIIGVLMTNNGSGYTSNPTVSFSGGAGSGATGSPQVGCVNAQSKIINFHFFAASPVATGSGIFLNGGSTYTPGAGGGSNMTLRNYNGSWYQTAVSTN